MKIRTALVACAALLPLVATTPSFAAGGGGGGGGGGTGADIQVSGSASTGSPVATQSYTYTFQVKNSGPQLATSITLTNPLPAGTTLNWAQVQSPYFAINCTTSVDATGVTIVSCPMGTLSSGTQVNVLINVTAPPVVGTVTDTATVNSADVADPKPSNNAVTVNVQVKTAACTVPAGQPTLYGYITYHSAPDANGLWNDFAFQVGAVDYWVTTNFYDGTAPLTSIINLACKTSPVQFVTSGSFVYVTGVVDDVNHTINASVVQVLTFKDLGA